MSQVTIKGIKTHSLSIDKSDNDHRTFTGIISAEVLDKQSEFIAVMELVKVMPLWFEHGATIIDFHSNRPVGKGLGWCKVELDDEKGGVIHGIMIKAEIFKGYELNDHVWKLITDKVYKGLSIGGSSRSNRVPATFSGGSMGYMLKDLELYEVSVCPEPSNPLSVIVDYNQFAKAIPEGGDVNSYNYEKFGKADICLRCEKVNVLVEKSEPSMEVSESPKGEIEVNIITPATDMLLRSSVAENNDKTLVDKEEKEMKNEKKDGKDDDDKKDTEKATQGTVAVNVDTSSLTTLLSEFVKANKSFQDSVTKSMAQLTELVTKSGIVAKTDEDKSKTEMSAGINSSVVLPKKDGELQATEGEVPQGDKVQVVEKSNVIRPNAGASNVTGDIIDNPILKAGFGGTMSLADLARSINFGEIREQLENTARTASQNGLQWRE